MRSKISIGIIACVAVSHVLIAQTTKLNLQSQSKNADLSSVGPTKPAQTGTALTSTCGVGELFFLTTATAGTNLYLCTAANTWTPSAASSGTSSLTVKSNGTSAGTTNSLNLLPATGSTVTVTAAGSDLDITYAPDTSVLATRSNVQAGSDNYCHPASGSPSAYACSEPNTLAVYTEGMLITWAPDVACAGGAAITLNIDSNGAERIYQYDGVSNPLASQCAPGTQVLLAYSGLLNAGAGGWRILSAPVLAVNATPASSSAACTTGQTEYDSSYYYICVATNTWKRSALSAF